MPNLSQSKRERMLAFLQNIKDEHRDDDDMLIALGEIESELTSRANPENRVKSPPHCTAVV